MKNIIFLLLVVLLISTSANADILIYSPDGKYVKKPTLDAAVKSPDVAGKTVVVTSAINIDSVTVPSNVTLKCNNNGVIYINKGSSLTINGPFHAGIYQVFKGPGIVKFNNKIAADINPKWWGALGNGVNDDTVAIQATIDSAASSNVKAVIFTPGTYIVNAPISEPGTQSYSSAIVINKLNNCAIKGTTNVTIRAGTGGAGAADFALFRIQASTNIEIYDLKFEGDATVNHFRDGGSRSGGIYITSFNIKQPSIDLDLTKNIHIHNIECNDMGGFVKVLKRNETALPPQKPVYNITIENCTGYNSALKDNCIGLNYTIGIKIRNNRFTNSPTANPYPSLFIDLSRGTEDAEIAYNYGSNFYYGMKSESANISVLGVTEHRFSKNISFLHNELHQIGHPTNYTPGGPSGGECYGIKANSINVQLIGNRISGLHGVGVTHGLATGIYLTQIADNEIPIIVRDNIIERCKNGIIQSNFRISTIINNNSAIIESNEIRNVTGVGIIAQARAVVQNNKIFNSRSYAISVQVADRTIIRSNFAYNCGTPGTGVVFYQEEINTLGYFEFIDNNIEDTRGDAAAAYGYSFATANYGTPHSNKYKFRSGSAKGIATISHP